MRRAKCLQRVARDHDRQQGARGQTHEQRDALDLPVTVPVTGHARHVHRGSGEVHGREDVYERRKVAEHREAHRYTGGAERIAEQRLVDRQVVGRAAGGDRGEVGTIGNSSAAVLVERGGSIDRLSLARRDLACARRAGELVEARTRPPRTLRDHKGTIPSITARSNTAGASSRSSRCCCPSRCSSSTSRGRSGRCSRTRRCR